MVLERVPNARLIIAGANHHTRAGYWESIRDAQPAHLPIEFRGYVAETDIPDLFQSTSVLVLPYDSATGSSGPAHQACEYGVPIVCADILDLRGMVTDEDMAVRFYKIGNAGNLADQLVTILQSPAIQRQMAHHNFAAGVEMTMSNVVNNYLRWFELNRAKREIRDAGIVRERRRMWLRNLQNRSASPGWNLHPDLFTPRAHSGNGFEPPPEFAQLEACPDPFTWIGPAGSKDGSSMKNESSARTSR